MTLHTFEDDAIYHVAEGDDQNHDGDDSAHVVEVAAHHQNLAEAETEIKHFSGNERAPSEGPALLEPRNNEGQTRGQQDIPEQFESLGAEVPSSLSEDFRHLLAAVFHGQSDREQGTHDHYEEDGVLVEAEPKQRERPPADAG